jgi:hypothetical protein
VSNPVWLTVTILVFAELHANPSKSASAGDTVAFTCKVSPTLKDTCVALKLMLSTGVEHAAKKKSAANATNAIRLFFKLIPPKDHL